LFHGFPKITLHATIYDGKVSVLTITGKIACAVLIISVATSFLFSLHVSAQAGFGSELKAKALLTVVSRLNQTAMEAVTRLSFLGNGSNAEAEQHYLSGCTFAQQALDLVKKGNYSSAVSAGLEAMRSFQRVLKIAETALNGSSGTAVAAEGVITLKAAVNRTYEYLKKVGDLAASAEENGFNVTEIKKVLTGIRVHLTRAVEKLSLLDVDSAMQELTVARTLLDQLALLQNDLSEQMKVNRTSEYVAEAEQRIVRLRANITAASTAVSVPVQTASLSALNQAETSLATAKDYLNAGKINDTIAELVNFRSQEQRSISIMQAAGVNVGPQSTDAAHADQNSSVTPKSTAKPGQTSANASTSNVRSTP
jgi:hypothetical protein